MTAKRKLIAGTVIMGVVTVISGGVLFVRSAIELPAKAYAMWAAGDLVVEHLKLNTNAWPRSWAELERTYRTLENRPPNPVRSTFEEIHSRVLIDWDAKVGELAKARFTNDFRPFQVVRLLNGEGTHYAGTEPNAAIWTDLQWVSNLVVIPLPPPTP